MKQNKVPKNEYTNGEPSPYRKNPFKKDVFYGDDGQYAYPGQVTRIPGDAFGTHITMKGINEPLYARDNQGNEQMMQPGEDYQFPGQYVTEYPQMAKNGGGLLNKTLTCSSCGWSWKAVDGGKDIATCHKCGGTAKLAYGGDPSLPNITGHYQGGGAQTPEEWEKEIRAVENKIGDPSTWTLDSYKTLQDKLNEYKAWRENTPKGKAVVDYHNEPNEYVVFPPAHLNKEKYNMKRALELGYQPDETEHWPSVDSETGMWLKSKKHPTAWMEYMYGQLDPELAKAYNVRVNPEGYFGDDQLQYVPKKPFGGQNSKTGTHFQEGGWLDELQKGGDHRIVIPKDEYNMRLDAEADSFNTMNYTKSILDGIKKGNRSVDFLKKSNAGWLYGTSKVKPVSYKQVIEKGIKYNIPIYKKPTVNVDARYKPAKGILKSVSGWLDENLKPVPRIGVLEDLGDGAKKAWTYFFGSDDDDERASVTNTPVTSQVIRSAQPKPVVKLVQPSILKEPGKSQPVKSKVIKPSMTKDNSRRLMTGEDWQDVNSNDYGAEEAKIRSADPEKFDIYRLPNNKFELVPKTKKPSQTLKKTLTSIKKKELSPIIVNDPNDPRLKAYDDSLGLYKSTDYLLSHPLTGDYVPGKEYFKNSKINTDNDNKRIGVKEDLRTGYVNLYKKPVQPYVYKEPVKEQPKKAEPKKAEAKKDYATRNVDFSSPYGPVMKYYDEAGKVIRTEPYVLPQQKNGGWLDKYQDAGQLRAASTTAAVPVSTQAPINPTNATNLDWVAEKWRNRDQGPSDWNFPMMDKSGSYVDSGIDPFTAFLSAPQQVIKTVSTTLPKAVKAVGEKFKSLKGLPNGAKAVENFKKVMGNDLDIDKVISLSQHEKDIALNRENLIKAAISGNQEEFTKAQNTINHLMAQLADQTKNTGEIGGKLGTAKDIGSKLKIEGPADNPYKFLPNKKDPKLGTWTPMFGYKDWMNHGHTYVPGFNQELNYLKTKAQYGKRPLETKIGPTDAQKVLVRAEDIPYIGNDMPNVTYGQYLNTDLMPGKLKKYTAKEAFQQLTPNKYGGQQRGWLDELDELDEEYRRGGMVNPLMKARSKRSGTSKNIQSSINKLFLRNKDLFGPDGKNIYNPKSKYQDGGLSDAEANYLNRKAYEESLAQARKDYINDFVKQGTKQALLESPFNLAAGFTPAGAAMFAGQSAASALQNTSQGDYLSAGLDAAFALPLLKPLKQIKALKGLPKGAKAVEALKKTSSAIPKTKTSLLETEKYLAKDFQPEGKYYITRTGMYDKPSDPNYLHDFKVYKNSNFLQHLPSNKYGGQQKGWLDNLH